MKPLEMRELDSEELLIRALELKEELFNLRFQLATGQLDNHRRMQQARREIARIKTILREREIAAYYRLQEQATPQAAGETSGEATESVEEAS